MWPTDSPVEGEGTYLHTGLSRGPYHIVPWQSAFRSKDIMGREPRFVLAASGHIAGVINPPARNKLSHWLNENLDFEAKDWLDTSDQVPAPAQPGNASYQMIEPAPGRYVKQKSN